MFSLINLPTPSEFFSQVGSWSTAFFDELKPVLYFIVGISLAVIFAFFILRLVSWLYSKVKGKSEEE
jgi:predicted permease